jgi:hypothetical protein
MYFMQYIYIYVCTVKGAYVSSYYKVYVRHNV